MIMEQSPVTKPATTTLIFIHELVTTQIPLSLLYCDIRLGREIKIRNLG